MQPVAVPTQALLRVSKAQVQGPPTSMAVNTVATLLGISPDPALQSCWAWGKHEGIYLFIHWGTVGPLIIWPAHGYHPLARYFSVHVGLSCVLTLVTWSRARVPRNRCPPPETPWPRVWPIWSPNIALS